MDASILLRVVSRKCQSALTITPVPIYTTHSLFFFIIGYISLCMLCSDQGSVLGTDILRFSHIPLRAEWYSDMENLHVANYKTKFNQAS